MSLKMSRSQKRAGHAICYSAPRLGTKQFKHHTEKLKTDKLHFTKWCQQVCTVIMMILVDVRASEINSQWSIALLVSDNWFQSAKSQSGINQATGKVMPAHKVDVPEGDVPWKVRLLNCVWCSQLLERTAADTTHDFKLIFGDDAIKVAAIGSLYRQFCDGRQEMCDLKRTGHPLVSKSR